MSEQVQQNLKVTDQGAEKTVQKTPEAVKDGGVIAAQPNQEVHGQAFANAHQNDKTLSEPDLIAMNDGETVAEYKARVAQIQANRFGFFDSEEEKKNDAGDAGGAKIHERPAKQAVEPMPPVNLSDPEFQSSVKLNVQITNVPEVSDGVKPEELLHYTDTMLQSGAQAVRQIERHMTEPNAINNDVSSLAAHFSQSPNQLNRDVQAVLNASVDQIDHPMTMDERARAAGELMPMFFFEGNAKEPVHPETSQQLGLETMSESELKSLGIYRAVPEMTEFQMPKVPEHLSHLELQPVTQELIDAVESKGRSVTVAEFGSQEWLRLEAGEANALVEYPNCTEILIKSNAPRAALLEEFLHGTQAKLGIMESYEHLGMAEVHVKEFMMRHAKLLGLDANDITLLRALRDDQLRKLENLGYRKVGE